MFVPLLLILIGVAAMVDQLGFVIVDWELIWPALLIVLGVHMMIRHIMRHKKHGGMCKECNGKVCNDCPECKHCDTHK